MNAFSRLVLSIVVVAWAFDTVHFEIHYDTLMRIIIVFAHAMCAIIIVSCIWQARVPS